MSFQQDVDATPGLKGAYCRGLRAVRGVDRARITATPPRNLTGSVDVDSALTACFPQSPRWDYVVAWKSPNRSEQVHWIEVHPAGGAGTIREVSAKLTWLKGWLAAGGKQLNTYERKFVWIASGKSTIQQNSPQMKKLVLTGVFFAGSHYTITG